MVTLVQDVKKNGGVYAPGRKLDFLQRIGELAYWGARGE